jgi:AhpD family alkylhydroperoxidase
LPHIDLPEGMPGIRGLMMYRPETAQPINQLVNLLLQGPSSLTKGEREMIATRVSTLNECKYCSSIHGAVARAHLGADAPLVAQVAHDPDSAPVSSKS